LASSIAYSLLYWAFSANFTQKHAEKLIKIFFASSVVVSIYGVLEHFGIDKDIWVQDVQSRVFSTLGQPNWLAAFVTALIPLSWAYAMKSSIKSRNFLVYFSVSLLLFWTLIFTKSRSGLLGFGIGAITFYLLTFWEGKKDIAKLSMPSGLYTFNYCGLSHKRNPVDSEFIRVFFQKGSSGRYSITRHLT
jgi:O-antigen ligase